MEPSDQPELLEILKGLGYPTTPERLLARGRRRVRSIGVEELVLLVEKAVNRTILARTIGGLDEDELDLLVAHARSELAGQIAASRDLSDSRAAMQRHRQRIRAELAALRNAIVARRGPVGPPERETADRSRPALDRRTRIRLRLQALLLPVHDRPLNPASARRVVEEILAVLAESEAEAVAEARSAIDREHDVLERRIAKLVDELEHAERAIERLARTKDLEFGIASIYRSVQGLDEGEGERRAKLEMLARIFQLNLELHTARSGAAGVG